jgi:hypothetical protein
VTPIVGQGHLFVFMEPTSPKGHDLQRDGRYALHCSMDDSSGAGGEFTVTGLGHLVADPELRALAAELASYPAEDRYILFELEVASAASKSYPGGPPVRHSWKRKT